jgi:hypothetical protein
MSGSNDDKSRALALMKPAPGAMAGYGAASSSRLPLARAAFLTQLMGQYETAQEAARRRARARRKADEAYDADAQRMNARPPRHLAWV